MSNDFPHGVVHEAGADMQAALRAADAADFAARRAAKDGFKG